MNTFETSESLANIGPALAIAQGAVEGATKGKSNPAFKSKYADLASVWEACREALTTNGLSVIQSPGEIADGRMGMTTMLLHKSGEWVRGFLTIPLGKVDAQAYGSATTYARRYALAAFVGVAPEDDDGNAATQAAPKSNSAYQAKKDGKGERFNELLHDMRSQLDDVELNQWAKDHADEILGWPEAWRKQMREELEEQRRRNAETSRKIQAANEAHADLDEEFRNAVGPASSSRVAGRSDHRQAEAV